MAITRLLIANRGEVACRIIRTCHELGIRTVAVYSDADAAAQHVQLADEAVRIGPAPVTESYLNIEAIIAAAARTHTDAIHPGFGFLAENPAFARACAEAGLIFIGPSPEAIEAMGNKRAAKERLAQVGIPVIPGYGGRDQSDERFQAEAEQIGYPVMVKAADGGGGKGMRRVESADALAEALASARREGLAAFGSAELILEKALTRPRHIEFQIIGDTQGEIIHLGERECSVQRRHQKVIEETPSLALTPELRAAMGVAAIRVGQTIHYVNAGTVEFLLDSESQFYFLEMNTRLQVEHPVTELVTGLDLAVWQIRIAAGEPLPFTQADIHQRGHAIECRVYAEDPANQFMPSIGEIAHYQRPSGPGVRVDDGIESGTAVTPYYDPMLAKVITWGADRAEAVAKMERALRETAVLGITTNIPYLLAILQEPHFRAGHTSTGYLQEHMADWSPVAEKSAAEWVGTAVFELLHGAGKGKVGTAVAADPTAQPDPWQAAPAWRNVKT